MLAFPTVPTEVPEGPQPICRQPRFVPHGHSQFVPFFVVAAIHVLAVYMLLLSPAREVIKSASAMMVTLIHEQRSVAPKIIQATKPPLARMPQLTLAQLPAPPVAISFTAETVDNHDHIAAPTVQRVFATAAVENRIELPRFDMAYLNNPAPIYPALSKRLREQGKVLLRVRVSADGAAEQIDVQASSGASRLDNAAIDAVRHWRFIPARRGDDAVVGWALVPINFQLA